MTRLYMNLKSLQDFVENGSSNVYGHVHKVLTEIVQNRKRDTSLNPCNAWLSFNNHLYHLEI